MRNTIEKGRLSFVILQREEGFLAICREFGFVEEGNSYTEVKDHIVNGAIATLEAVRKNPELMKSLNTRPPFKYLMMYYLAPLYFIGGKMVSYFARDTRSLAYA